MIVLYSKIVLRSLLSCLSTIGKGNPVGNRQDYLSRLNITISPIVDQYREEKVKSSPVEGGEIEHETIMPTKTQSCAFAW